jgi:hypothetical protein
LGFLVGTLLLTQAVPAQKKNVLPQNNPNYRQATDQDYVALAKAKEVVGHLLTIDGTQQMTLRVDYPTLELKTQNGNLPNRGSNAQRQIQNQLRQVDRALARQQQGLTRAELGFLRLQQTFLKQYLQILKVKNPAQQQQRYQQLVATTQLQEMQLMQQLAQAAAATGQMPNVNLANINLNAQNSPYKVVTATAEFALPIMDDIKVARTTLEIEYDDKGKVIQYTAEELKKKKHPNMPGYTAKREDALPGQLVKVYLGKSKAILAKEKAKEEARAKAKEEAQDKALAKEEAKDAAKVKAKEDAADKAAAKDKDKVPDIVVASDEDRPQVRMLLIMSDSDPAYLPKETPQKKGKKKKDQ